ncbi:hypothetical protein [Corynebacterium propinquum]|nr:hypothetical protein [Corynebacterium propinquum]MDK4314505.1 hypothetical protein [Corynebacterium propinquum]
MVSDGAMTLQEELTQTSPLQEALQYCQKTITERAFALEDEWKHTPPVEGFSEDNFYSRANLLLVRDAGISEPDLYLYIAAGGFRAHSDAFWYFVPHLEKDHRVVVDSLLCSPSLESMLNVHVAVRYLDKEFMLNFIEAMWNGEHFGM